MNAKQEHPSTSSGDVSLGPATTDSHTSHAAAPQVASSETLETDSRMISSPTDSHDADARELAATEASTPSIPDDAIEAAQSAHVPQPESERRPETLRQACQAAEICDQFRGEDIVVLDLTGITPLFDYFVIATGSSRRQMHAIVEEVDRVLKQEGSRRRGIEGYQESSWIVEDYGDVVLHVFTDESRENYDLEALWGDAPRVNWQSVLEAASV